MKSNISDKQVQQIRDQLKKLEKKQRDPKSLEIAIKAETEGLSFLQSQRRSNELREQWQIATEQTTGMMSGFLTGLFGQDLGKLLSKKYAKADEDQIKQAREYFDKFKTQNEKKEKVAAKKVEKSSKEFKTFYKKIINIQKSVESIQKLITNKNTTEIKSGYKFDPRMAGGGRFIDTSTNKIVSKDIALKRTEDLSKAIAADEDPMIRLTETVEAILKSVGKDNKSLHEKLNDIQSRMNDSDDSDIDLDLDRRRNRRRTPRRSPKKPGKFDKVRNVGRVGRFATVGAAAAGAVAITAAGVYALDKGMTEVGEKSKGKMDDLEKKYGLKTKYENGRAIGYDIKGDKYGLDDLPQEYKDLIDAYGPGDKRSFSAQQALKKIKQNPEKYKALEIDFKPTQQKKKTNVSPKVPISAETPKPSPVTNIQPSAATGVAQAISVATESPAAAVGVSRQAAPIKKGPEFRLGEAAAKRGKISKSEGKNAAIAAASKAGISGPHLAQFLAQLDHESAHFTRVEENLRYSAKRLRQVFPKYYKSDADAEADEYQPQKIANRVYANRMGNGPPESGDGYKYRGRGLIQLTGKDNYKRFGSIIGMDLVNNPDAAGNLSTAADIAAAFYKKNVVDKGIDGTDTKRVTKAINGGSIGLSDRESLFASYMKDPSSMQPSAITSGEDSTPSMYAKGQDQRINSSGAESLVAKTQDKSSSIGSASQSSMQPVASKLGSSVQQQSQLLASNQMEMQTQQAPIVNNVVNQSNPSVSPPQKTPMKQAGARPADSSFNRALAKDFAHPSAFTTVSMT